MESVTCCCQIAFLQENFVKVIKPLLVRSVCVDASAPLAGIPGALVHVDLAVRPVEALVAVATVGAGLQSRV